MPLSHVRPTVGFRSGGLEEPCTGEAATVREELEDANAFLRSIERDVREALFSTVEQLRPRWSRKVAGEVLKFTVGLEPHAGQIASAALTGAEMGSEWWRHGRSWVAALMVLRRRSS